MTARCPHCGTPEDRAPGCAKCAAARTSLAALHSAIVGAPQPEPQPGSRVETKPPVTELRPKGAGWVRRTNTNPLHAESVAESWWTHGEVVVGSSLVRASLPAGEGAGLQWLVSISESGRRPSRAAVRLALKAFGMNGAEEDNPPGPPASARSRSVP